MVTRIIKIRTGRTGGIEGKKGKGIWRYHVESSTGMGRRRRSKSDDRE